MTYLTKDDLKLAYGVDLRIGAFFVGRQVPVGNLYWKNRLIYIATAPGYYFIPIFFDLAYRIGLQQEDLLSEPVVQLAEAILHSAAKQEDNMISWQEHIDECRSLAAPLMRNASLKEDLDLYFSGQKPRSSVRLGTPYPSLNRADTFLFMLTALPFDEGQKIRLMECWYALMTYFLILDDLEDIRADFKNQEENSLIEAGLSERGALAIADMINQSHDRMLAVNPVMANRIDHKRSTIDLVAIIREFLHDEKKAG